MSFQFANRVNKIPPYLFAEIEEKVRVKKAQGVDIIDFGIGDPDLPTPAPIVEELRKHVLDPENHNYPSSAGEPETRQAVADFYKKRFDVDIDPRGQVCILLGSKEGLANIARAFVNPGEKVLCPDPAYPVYAQGATTLCDAVPVRVPLSPEHNFQIEDSPGILDRTAKMLYLNYPNNPTGACVSKEYLIGLYQWCVQTQTVMVYDNAYSELTFGDYSAPSILEVGDEGVIEFGSLSKTFNMTGYRLGYAVGDANLITGLKKVKSQIDSGAPKFVQKAAAFALEQYKGREQPKMVRDNMRIFEERRDIMVRGLRSMGFKVDLPKGTFYLWFRVDGSSMRFADRMLNEAGVVVTPGVGFGQGGEGFIRMALTQSSARIEEALGRMEKVLRK
ncbi:MAG: aminotransferase class I/II-fold pyridoxal phosphate-dependent enzyme [Methanomassiliicoccales archaeon]|jgi:LL-diaminopimelate aminotransferase|nr:aminotransferase class I/II-fold pyridoxal phosphate-dependent enzyme [Methanomassiliicoccales archaeon]